MFATRDFGAARKPRVGEALLKAVFALAALVAVNLATGGEASAQTWLDQRFFDDVPRAKGKWAQPSKLGGPASNSYGSSLTGTPKPKKQAKKSSGTKVAALSDDIGYAAPKKSLSGGGGNVRWVASSGCIPGSLKSVIYQVASNFGPVTVSSTCRSKSRNAAVGGASKSYHLSGEAADFRVHGNVSATYAFLKSNGSVGGLKHYGGGLFHIDTGPRRSW